ncbi:hypothetical protein ASPCAL10713 [Aspergillus calidoustus]|uniref:Uncharacterized protein n=1 Tax=Aspergillus calidoustus TaxID=454130 RepID=A0A0U5H1B4_ASPCI|nr:hypothetical protein ASPCAL10713 [Aspergillus calidoustus]
MANRVQSRYEQVTDDIKFLGDDATRALLASSEPFLSRRTPTVGERMTSADSEDEIETQLKDYAFTVNGAGYKLNETFSTRAEPCKVIAATLDGDICVLFLSRSLPS